MSARRFDMDGCADYEEMKQIACKDLRLLGNCKEFYLGLLGEEEGWVKVSFAGQEGYVSTDYVTDTEPQEQEENQ